MAITFDSPSIRYIPRRGRTFVLIVSYPSTTVSVTTPGINYISGSSGWISIQGTRTSGWDYSYVITVDPCSGYWVQPRGANIIFTANTNAGTEAEIFSIYQVQHYDCLWRDNIYSVQRVSNMPYILKDEDNNQLYKGTAATISSTYPHVELNIPRIVEGTFEHPSFNFDSDGNWMSLDITKVISLFPDNYISPAYTFPVIYNWEYDLYHYELSSDTVLNKPINGHATSWMHLPISIYNDSDADYSVEAYAGEEALASYSYGSPDYQTAEVCAYFDDSIVDADRIVVYNDTTSQPILTYNLQSCGNVALYYLNKMGGHDAFLIEGNVRIYDEYKRDQYTQNSRNTSPTNFEKTTIQNRITTTYELSTGWLTDEESEILASQLLPSPQVFLHDNRVDYRPMSANIVDTSVEHKEFRNGKKLNQYTITVEISQTKLFR